MTPFREDSLWWEAAVFVASLLGVRLYLVCGTSLEWVVRDTASYFDQTRAILDGGFIDYFPNGLPMVAAGVWSMFGAKVTEPFVLFNVVCSVATAVGVFFLARDWFEGLAGALYTGESAAFGDDTRNGVTPPGRWKRLVGRSNAFRAATKVSTSLIS